MSKNNNYLTYAASCEYEPQELYLDGNQNADICIKLSELGARRILMMRPDNIATYKKAVEFTTKLEKSNFKLFTYSRRYQYPSSHDITKAYSLYMEYNCDTIVVFGGEADIYCAKMVEAMAVNGIKDPTLFEGYNKIKKDISLLCCVGMDNSSAIASSSAEFKDENTGRWIVSLSNFLIPQMVVIDTDIAMRTYMADSVASALDSLAMAIEAFLSPACLFQPLYKASAISSINLVLSNLIEMKDHPDDSYLRRKIAMAGIYAGTATRMSGMGYAHITIHALCDRYKVDFGKLYLKLLTAFIKESQNRIINQLAEIYDYLVVNGVNTGIAGVGGIPEKMYTKEESAQAFIDLLESLYETLIIDEPVIPEMSEKDIKSLAESIKDQSDEFGLTALNSASIESVIKSL
ncbi:MAG: iron-containing alcohol dehydrogenase [Saccharofermentans sp.]|nr:iron-containing alcohol dehydrogenase [Saccharofermentans sp.]